MSLCYKNVFLVTQSRNSVRELVGFDWRSPRIHYCVLPSEHTCECTCVLEVGPVLWQRPGQTAGSSPCSRAQCSLSQQALVTSKNWRKGKHSARVPPSASLRVLSETQAQKPKRTQMSTHEVSFTPTKNICLLWRKGSAKTDQLKTIVTHQSSQRWYSLRFIDSFLAYQNWLHFENINSSKSTEILL